MAGKRTVEENTSKVYVEPHSSQPPIVSPNEGSGTQLFVINLCASIAPVSTTGRNIPGLENYKLYQVARVEDGRTRHRLRLGFFTNEAHAERILAIVRQQYPTAFTASLSEEDRRFTRGYVPERAPAAAPTPAVVQTARPAVAVVNTPAPSPTPAPKAAAPAPKAAAAAPAQPAVRTPAAQAPAKPAAAPPIAAAAKAAVAARPAPAVATKPAAPKAPEPQRAVAAKKSAAEEIVEMTWEPDEATRAAATSTKLPKIKALPEAAGLDDMSWDDEPAPLLSTSPGKEPLAVGLLSGRFAALDPNKYKPKQPAAPAATSKPSTPPAPVAVPPKLDTGASVRVPALTFSDPVPTPATAQKSNAPAEPYHVGKGMQIEDVADFELDLFDDPPTLAPPTPSAVTPKVPKASAPAAANKAAPVTNKAPVAKPATAAAPVAKKIETPVKPAMPAATAKPAPAVAAKPAPAAPKPAPAVAAKPAAGVAVSARSAAPAAPVLNQALAHPNLDSTQTIRALTNEELNDSAQEKWFAIQLAVSEQPVNLDTMPHLDIFEAYSLYSVATAGSGKIVHSLRLGFFKEAVSAEAVSGYLKTFFAAPSVIRISVAEQGRFKDAPQPRRAAPVEEPKNNVVELNNARTGRPTAPVVPTITMEVDPVATGSFRANASGSLNAASGSFKPGATGALKGGTFKPGATGSFKLNPAGNNKVPMPDGKIAAKSAGPAMKRSEPTRAANIAKPPVTKTLKKSLADELMEEAREVELSESGVRKMPQNGSLLSRLLGKKK
jgi:hypothetical protein